MRAFLRYTVNHISSRASALSRTAACFSKDTLYSVFVKSVNELIRFKRFSHYTLKHIDFFLSDLTVFLFGYASHLPVVYPAVRVYLCQSYQQSLQVTVLISALWLPIRFSWGLWDQLVCHCNSQTETKVPWLGINQICYPSASCLPQTGAIALNWYQAKRLHCYGKAF